MSVPTTVVANDSVTINRIEFNNATNDYVVVGYGKSDLGRKNRRCIACN